MRAYERLLKYVKIHTASDESTETVPSTNCQFDLARLLATEMKELGIEGARVDEKCYVYGTIPASAGCEDKPSIGFIAHMDTSSEASDMNIKTSIVDYNGGDILLNKEKDIYMKVSDYPYLEKYKGQHLIVSDGTTLIGADDKAGIAEIMTAVEEIIK